MKLFISLIICVDKQRYACQLGLPNKWSYFRWDESKRERKQWPKGSLLKEPQKKKIGNAVSQTGFPLDLAGISKTRILNFLHQKELQ